MKDQKLLHLSRRERQIMDAVYRLGRATAAELQDALPEPPGYSAVRAHLRVLEEKGHLRPRAGRDALHLYGDPAGLAGLAGRRCGIC